MEGKHLFDVFITTIFFSSIGFHVKPEGKNCTNFFTYGWVSAPSTLTEDSIDCWVELTKKEVSTKHIQCTQLNEIDCLHPDQSKAIAIVVMSDKDSLEVEPSLHQYRRLALPIIIISKTAGTLLRSILKLETRLTAKLTTQECFQGNKGSSCMCMQL